MKYIITILGFITYNLFYPFRKKKMQVLSLYFHNPAPSSFEKVVRWCLRKGYEFVEINDISDYVSGRKTNRKMVHISFDDGWATNIDLLPIVEKYKVPITIFVPVEPLQNGAYWWQYVYSVYKSDNYVEEYKSYPEEKFRSEIVKIKEKVKLERSAVTFEQLCVLNNHPLVDIQSHSYTHPILNNLSDQSLERELSESQAFLCNLLNKDINVFSYPNGSFSSREVNAVKRYYNSAYTTEEAYPVQGGDMHMIPRICLLDNYWSNLSRIVGAWQVIKRIKIKK